MRRLVCLAVLTLAAACGASEGEVGAPVPGGSSSDPNTFRADGMNERSYTGEWANAVDQCTDQRKIWTIEATRMGMQRRRFCIFDEIRVSRGSAEGEAWRADAKCLSDGKQSDDVVFFRVNATGQEMRVTINDSDAIDLVRCPMST